jgi:hypothetical protein
MSRSYVGWRWAVMLVRASRSKNVTVSESLLLPGPDSLVAPAWVPWTERVRPGDLKAGDLMPASADDERLIPAVAIDGADGLLDWDESDDWAFGADLLRGDLLVSDLADGDLADGGEVSEAALPEGRAAGMERGTGRRRVPRVEAGVRPTRVLSAIGRDETAVRWYMGEHGPRSALAAAAPGQCLTCGFLIRLDGTLGRIFGVCANEFAPDDGSVVSLDHGCGAHSDPGSSAGIDSAVPAIDELGYDMMSAGAALPESVIETLDHELL